MGTRRSVAVLVALGLVATLGWYLGRRFEQASPLPRGHGCIAQTDGSGVRLNAEQMANAATITAVGVRLQMPDRAVVVALATAFQESKLHNLPHLGAVNDHDSIGLFQQRPSQGWGSVEQISDPRYAAERFYRALRQVSGWEGMRVTEAAQRVQRSAFPEAYEKWAGDAGVLATALLGHARGAVWCTVDGDPPVRGTAAANALGAGLSADWGELTTVIAADAEAFTLAADHPRDGWRYAHWLVAHAAEHGVARVRFADLEWTAGRGTWSPADTPSEHVRAEVFTDA